MFLDWVDVFLTDDASADVINLWSRLTSARLWRQWLTKWLLTDTSFKLSVRSLRNVSVLGTQGLQDRHREREKKKLVDTDSKGDRKIDRKTARDGEELAGA